MLFGFVNVELAINFHFSHLNFKVGISNELNDYWHFFLFYHIENFES